MLTLTVALALGQVLALPSPEGPIFSQPSLMGSGAFFELAPASGAGMGAACACAAITGAKGEAVTFTRTGNATCSMRGLATTGIANGDLVTCAGDQPRVERQSDGVLGLRVESSGTNVLPRSSAVDNAIWTKQGGNGPAAPSATADTATAPDGTVTADTLGFPSVSVALAFSIAYQSLTGTAAPWTCSVFVRGASTSGTTYLALTPNSSSFSTSSCSFVSTSWTRCTLTATLTAATWYFQIGTDLRDGAQSSTPAQDVLVNGMGCETGAFATSYIPTVAAAVTRNEEFPVFSVTRQVPSGSIAMTVEAMTSIITGAYWAATDTAGRIPYSGTNTVVLYDGTNAAAVAPVPAYTAGSINRIGGYWGGGTQTAFTASASGSSAFDGAMGVAGSTLTLGGSAAGGVTQPGIYSRICYDPDPSRCR